MEKELNENEEIILEDSSRGLRVLINSKSPVKELTQIAIGCFDWLQNQRTKKENNLCK
jgi:hypothetical protein